jgi:hypothetical protein
MAVYQIFASADATIYSRYPSKNTGRDPILEVSAKNSQDGTRFLFREALTNNPYYTYDLAANGNYSTTEYYFPDKDIRRALIQFSPADIAKLEVFASGSISGSWKANLKLYLASAQNLNTTYSLDVFAISQSWAMGTGQFAQTPESRNGVSWTYTGPYQNSPAWATTGSSFVTASSVNTTAFTGSQFFDYMSNKDINMNISDVVGAWFAFPNITTYFTPVGDLTAENGDLLLTENSDNLVTSIVGTPNYGLVVKHPDYIENNTSSFVDLKFFSIDTHTIYPPTIEFKWADAVYGPTGSWNLATNDQITIVLQNNPGQFRQNEVYKVRTAVRETYPARQFTTSSVYLTQLYLPEQSYWSLMDYKTNEVVIDFDPEYTKLSADTQSNYFTLYTSGLEVNRFYKILIKTILPSGEEVIYTNENLIFKVVQ